MRGADLVAIAVLDSTAPAPLTGGEIAWPVRIERAWKWPGGGAAPPPGVVVARRSGAGTCALGIWPGDRQLVVAWIRPADGALVLGTVCATPWGAVDTLGRMAGAVRRARGDSAVQAMARAQARLLDSLQAYGSGTKPAT